MTVTLRHKFVSPVPDEGDPNIVGPNEWNDDHDLTLNTDKLLGRDTAGSGPAEEIGVTGGIEFDGAGNIRLAAAGITNAQLADMAAYTLKGRNAGTTGAPSDISIAALTEKVTPVDDDLLLLVDSEDGNSFKKVKNPNVGAGGGVDTSNAIGIRFVDLRSSNIVPDGNFVIDDAFVQHLDLSENGISSIDGTGATSLIELRCNQCGSLETIDVSGLTNLTRLRANEGALTSVDLTGCTALVDVELATNLLDQANVDAVLVALDNNGASNGNVDLSMNAVPSATGLAAKTSLEGRGWTVTVDV